MRGGSGCCHTSCVSGNTWCSMATRRCTKLQPEVHKPRARPSRAPPRHRLRSVKARLSRTSRYRYQPRHHRCPRYRPRPRRRRALTPHALGVLSLSGLAPHALRVLGLSGLAPHALRVLGLSGLALLHCRGRLLRPTRCLRPASTTATRRRFRRLRRLRRRRCRCRRWPRLTAHETVHSLHVP